MVRFRFLLVDEVRSSGHYFPGKQISGDLQMKSFIFLTSIVFSFQCAAVVPVLSCELFQNEVLMKAELKEVAPTGITLIRLGQIEEFTFAGYAHLGLPGTLIVGPWASTKTEESTDHVTSGSGKLLRITCKILP